MRLFLKDFERFYNLLTSPELVGDITDDYGGDMFQATKNALMSPHELVLMPTKGTAFTLHCVNSILYEAHLITTESEKQDVYYNTLISSQWVKDNTLIEAFISNIPVIYGATLYYSQKIGMEHLGVIPNGFLKNENRVDINIMGCSVDTIIRRLSWLK